MTPRLRWLLGLAAVLAVCCAVVLVGQANSRPKRPARSPAAAPASKAARPPSGPTEEIVLTLLLPAQDEPLSEVAGSHGPDCPQTQVCALFGIEIAAPHGIRVGKVLAGSPAEAAGIVPGDSIVKCDGDEVTCPSTLVPYLEQRKERKPVELTVQRALSQTEDAGSAAKETTQAEPNTPAGSAE